MKNIFKKSNIFSFVLGALIFGSIGAVCATSLFDAKDVTFNPTDSSWDAKDVKSALDDLYEGNSKVPNVVKNWLYTAKVNKDYSSLQQVFDDTGALQSLMSSNKACKYLKGSHDWISNVTGNENAMTYIGNNESCADILYADEYWAVAMASSQYLGKAFTRLATTSSTGSIFANAQSYGSAWNAFDDNTSTQWSPTNGVPTANDYVGFTFNTPATVKAVEILTDSRVGEITVEASNDGSTWVTLVDYFLPPNYEYIGKTTNNNTAYTKYRIRFKSGNGSITPRVMSFRLYGRQ